MVVELVMVTPDIEDSIKDILNAYNMETIGAPFIFPSVNNAPDLGMKRFDKCWPKINAFDYTQYEVRGYLRQKRPQISRLCLVAHLFPGRRHLGPAKH